MNITEVESLLERGAVRKFTGPPEHWITAIQKMAWCLSTRYKKQWKRLQVGDIVLFHCVPQTYRGRPGIIGFGIVQRSGHWVKDELWWYAEYQTEKNQWPLVVEFSDLYVTGRIDKINFKQPINEKTPEQLTEEVRWITENAVPLSVYTKTAKRAFPAQASIATLDKEGSLALIKAMKSSLKHIKQEGSTKKLKPQFGTALQQLIEQHQQYVREQLRQRLSTMNPYAFEQLAGKLLEALDFSEVTTTKRSKDGGIDGYGKLRMGIVEVKAAFQCKRWKGPVPRSEIDRFRGAIQGQFDQGIFITTSHFSPDALEASTQPGSVPIVMLDIDKVLDLMIQHGIGVRQEPLMLTRIDDSFFDESEQTTSEGGENE